MSPFWSGAAGAAAVLLLAGLVRRALWQRRFRAFRRGRGLVLRGLFRRLGTRPDQEQALQTEADALAEALHALRAEAGALRSELADLLAGPAVDGAAVEALLERRLDALTAPRARLAQGVARVHATLDTAQRERLAALVRHGPHRHHRHHGPAAA